MESKKVLDRVDESLRYSRHFRIPEIGNTGQEKLSRASVAIVGAGGLGSPAALYLAAAGVGRIGLIDDDRVSLSNLQRQILYATAEVGWPKVYSARNRLQALNPEIVVEAREERVTASNALSILNRYDFVIDGTDSFASRYLLNDACVLLGKPLAYGAVSRFDGQATLFVPGMGCYRCLYPKPASAGTSCDDAGVLGVLPGLVGTIQATEALKHILSLGESLAGRLLSIDALSMRFDTFAVMRRTTCPACGDQPSIRSLQASTDLCAQGEPCPDEVSWPDLDVSAALLLDLRSDDDFHARHIPGARRFEDVKNQLGFDEELVLYCKSGARSGWVAAELRDQGFTRVRSLRGGFLEWLRHIG